MIKMDVGSFQNVITIPDDDDSDNDSIIVVGQNRMRSHRLAESSGSETDIDEVEPENADSDSETDLFVSSSDETDIDEETQIHENMVTNAASGFVRPSIIQVQPVLPTWSQPVTVPVQSSSMGQNMVTNAATSFIRPNVIQVHPALSSWSQPVTAPVQSSSMGQSTSVGHHTMVLSQQIPNLSATGQTSSNAIQSTSSSIGQTGELRNPGILYVDMSDSQSSNESQGMFVNIPTVHNQPVHNLPGHNTPVDISQTLNADPIMSAQFMVNQHRVEVTEMPMEVENVSAAGSTSVNDSLLDFTAKKEKKKESKKESEDSSDDEGQCCIICYEPWANSGLHRVASLKCGHVFGQSCIEKWLRGNCGKCPQCNAKAKKADIRVLYVKALKVLDTAERDRALRDLDSEKTMRRTAEIKTEQFRLKYQMALEEIKSLKMKMKALESGTLVNQRRNAGHCSTATVSSVPEIVGKYVLQKTIQVSANGKCRVMTYDCTYNALLVSLPSPQPLFPGFGVKKISAIDASCAYISIHKNFIRDLCCNSRQDGLLLTAGADKTMKITSLSSFNTVQMFKSDLHFWACAWNTNDVNYIYGGLQNGSVLVYDTRQPNTEVQVLTNENYSTPMVSLIYVPHGEQSSTSGLLMNTLETNGFWEKKEGAEWFCHNLDMDRKCTGMSFEHNTHHLLASYRAHDEVRNTRRVMYNFQCQTVGATDTKLVRCTPVETFYGGSTMKQLTRSRLFRSPVGPDKLFACGGDEASGSAHVWDASSGKLLQKLQVNANVLDVCPFEYNNTSFLATLTEKDLKIFNWQK
ncbi:E3 ubiquitin-protein ligase RFWD3-like [Anneissia japonica]|uniref:E3 ubiquitin-protein ligase RFWD3-like n=1 Tax=Anneissia japonica TaxID=1529436 RepID=UPI0014258A16|nr:E3 ubiquitin-protein ligase RFWD3-like [Anneissia japonica]XP_033116888.1 E3 ubiquitin-protein ligase RFWD3-like [Anneissia japonica]